MSRRRPLVRKRALTESPLLDPYRSDHEGRVWLAVIVVGPRLPERVVEDLSSTRERAVEKPVRPQAVERIRRGDCVEDVVVVHPADALPGSDRDLAGAEGERMVGVPRRRNEPDLGAWRTPYAFGQLGGTVRRKPRSTPGLAGSSETARCQKPASPRFPPRPFA